MNDKKRSWRLHKAQDDNMKALLGDKWSPDLGSLPPIDLSTIGFPDIFYVLSGIY